jgi:hypothetical protein
MIVQVFLKKASVLQVASIFIFCLLFGSFDVFAEVDFREKPQPSPKNTSIKSAKKRVSHKVSQSKNKTGPKKKTEAGNLTGNSVQLKVPEPLPDYEAPRDVPMPKGLSDVTKDQKSSSED